MFEFFINCFNTLLYEPLFNALILLYEYLPGNDFGIAVIVLTVLIKLALSPLGIKGIKAQKALAELQPRMKEIQEKFKHDKEKQAKAMMAFYQKEKINPLSGCLPLLVQLPIIIALYRVFWNGFKDGEMVHLYSFVPFSGVIDPMFLGLIDLSVPCIPLAFLAGCLQFFQTKMMSSQKKTNKEQPIKKNNKETQFSDIMQKQMLYFFPIFTVFILWNLPSAIGLYWATFTIFAIAQQHFIFKSQEIKQLNIQTEK